LLLRLSIFQSHVLAVTLTILLRVLLHTHAGDTELVTPSFYRAMHFGAKRGIAIACRLTGVCDVGEL